MVNQLKRFNLLLLASLAIGSVGCTQIASSSQTSLYDKIGGEKKVELIVDNFVKEIEFNQTIFTYFAEANVKRFKEKLAEHICVHTQGPCQYTGDDMVKVHEGMNITEADFNLTVELLINAMTDAGVAHTDQNKILAAFAPMRESMIYR